MTQHTRKGSGAAAPNPQDEHLIKIKGFNPWKYKPFGGPLTWNECEGILTDHHLSRELGVTITPDHEAQLRAFYRNYHLNRRRVEALHESMYGEASYMALVVMEQYGMLCDELTDELEQDPEGGVSPAQMRLKGLLHALAAYCTAEAEAEAEANITVDTRIKPVI